MEALAAVIIAPILWFVEHLQVAYLVMLLRSIDPGPATMLGCATEPGDYSETVAAAVVDRPPPRPSPFFDITRDVVYVEREGSDPSLTSLDVCVPRSDADDPRPILVFIHGGGWAIGDKRAVQRKPFWAARNGWIFVSINYRLSPEDMHPEHARDAAAAIAFVREHAGEWGGDPDNIAILGHSAGAHIAGIVASDESLLAEHGMAPADLSGVVLLDGAGYNLPVRMADLPRTGLMARWYRNAFGDDPDLWQEASPTLQAKPGDDLPPLFCVHAGDREESEREGAGLVKAWGESGAAAQLHHAPDKDHAGINKLLGDPDDPDTIAIRSFLIKSFEDDHSADP